MTQTKSGQLVDALLGGKKVTYDYGKKNGEQDLKMHLINDRFQGRDTIRIGGINCWWTAEQLLMHMILHPDQFEIEENNLNREMFDNHITNIYSK